MQCKSISGAWDYTVYILMIQHWKKAVRLWKYKATPSEAPRVWHFYTSQERTPEITRISNLLNIV